MFCMQAPVRRKHTGGNSASNAALASVPHTAVLSACNSQRRHALGALTECLVSPHCWVLGPPTPSAGHRPFTTLRQHPLPARHRTKGPQTRRVRRIPLRAGDETGAPLRRIGMAVLYLFLGMKSTYG